MTRSRFKMLIEGQFDWSRAQALHELAAEYHERCEAFDQLLCGPAGMPRNGRELGEINLHARKVLRDVELKAADKEIDSNELRREIQRIAREFDP